MKRGFTMIELIFVIVILGILAAVALPKFVGMSSQAREGNLKSFTGTLNGTVGPTLWSKAISAGDDGNISALGSEADLTKYTELPKTITDQNVTKCDSTTDYKVIAEAPKAKVGGDYNYYIFCKTGTTSEAPKFLLMKNSGTHSLGDTNTSSDKIVQ